MPRMGAQCGERLRLDIKIKTGGKTHRPQQPQIILVKARNRVTDGADQSRGQILLPTDIIDQCPGERVVEHAIDSEVPALRVSCGIDELDRLGPPAVAIWAIAAKAGDLVGAPVYHHHADAELRPDLQRAVEKPRHRVGIGVGGHVPVLGRTAQHHIAHTSTRQ